MLRVIKKDKLMGENVAMEGFVGFKVAILGALFSAMVAAETQYFLVGTLEHHL